MPHQIAIVGLGAITQKSHLPAIAANPFLTFSTIAMASGTLEFRWTGDNGFELVETASITVE